jgi:prepilin-type N-terminal cleavage/methylation domain-containing protein
MKRAKGFTLVELVIVIVIVGILSIVAVPIYRGYTRKAMGTEAKSLLGSIQTAQKVYYAENSTFKAVELTDFDEELDVDARSNKYFTGFEVEVQNENTDNLTFIAKTSGKTDGAASGISMTLQAYKSGSPKWNDVGLNN